MGVEGLDIGIRVCGKLMGTARGPNRMEYVSVRRLAKERLGRDGNGCSIYPMNIRTAQEPAQIDTTHSSAFS